jgi:hypothetical protein
MSSLAVSGIVFVCVFVGALAGMYLRLPEHHLGAESKDVVKLGMGLIGTMSALVLGLLIGSAKGSFDTQRNEFTQLSANVIYLDRILARYGPEAKEARELLRQAVSGVIARIWPEDHFQPGEISAVSGADALYDKILSLEPKTEAQRTLQAQAVKLLTDLAQTRWLLFAQRGSSIPMPFLVILVGWLTILFVSFGLFASPNATALGALLVCALSVAGAILLILELDRPYGGIIEISSAPLRNALAQMGH